MLLTSARKILARGGRHLSDSCAAALSPAVVEVAKAL
jgi:hypothetical protein